MDSPPEKIGSAMDGKTPHLLPLSMTVTASVTAAKKTSVDVRRVSAWALFNAFVFFVSDALGYATDYALNHYQVPCSQNAFFLRCSQLTDAEVAQETALWIVMLCCAAAQAAAALLALQLRCRHRWVRRALVDLALALTIVCHCMFGADVWLNLAADPEDVFCWIFCTVDIVFFAAGDIICYMALLVREIEEQD